MVIFPKFPKIFGFGAKNRFKLCETRNFGKMSIIFEWIDRSRLIKFYKMATKEFPYRLFGFRPQVSLSVITRQQSHVLKKKGKEEFGQLYLWPKYGDNSTMGIS